MEGVRVIVHLREMDTPSLVSLQAAAITSGVSKFSVPFKSFCPSRSNMPTSEKLIKAYIGSHVGDVPQAQPCGIPSI